MSRTRVRRLTRQRQPSDLRSWSVRLVGLLLLLQVGALGGIVVYYFRRFDELNLAPTLTVEELPLDALEFLAISGVFILIGVIGAVGAIIYLFFFRAGWMLAMITQAATLSACLLFYFNLSWTPGFLYPLMLSAVLLVLYLNSYDVRLAFHARPAAPVHE